MSAEEKVPWAIPLSQAELDEIPEATPLSPAEEWAYTGAWWSGFTTSYKVVSLAYDRTRSTLVAEYEGGTFWEYYPVTFAQAVSLYEAPSIGEWFWDNVRVRGRGNIHEHQVGAARFTF